MPKLKEDEQINEPYPGVSADKVEAMDSCVEKVMAKGKDKEAAIAICYTSVVEGKDLEEAILSFDGLPSEEAMAEAATIKAKVRAAIRALDELLTEKEISEDMRAGVKALRESFKRTWADLATDATGDARQSESEPQITPENIIRFAESYGGVEITEDFSTTESNPARTALAMRIMPIRPGWGNRQQNHYYTPEVLRTIGPLLVGKKMYTTDHKEGEKSERTEVSKIDSLEGFSNDGSPIVKVSVFDPYFAEKTRNRAKVGALDMLECSILGSGTARPFEKDGRKGKLVESFTEIESVDWVTRAGAGGHALEIAESENPHKEGATMADEMKPVEVKDPEPEAPIEAPVAEAAEMPAPPAEPTRLSEVEVTGLLEAEKRLPQVSRVRLAESAYTNGEAVQAAITKELAYLKELQGSGQPFGLGGTPAQPKLSPAERAKLAEAALDRVNAKYLHNGGK